MPAIGEVLDDRYEIIDEIGAGGAGVVFLGYHRTLCKYVVVKKLREQAAEQLNIRGEADILKQLHHRYLPQVYDFLVIGNEIFTVMDYVDGHDLNWYMENGIVFSEGELVTMLSQLCEVLEYLHGQNPPIIHSDIKPGNIMIREDGDVCLIDFNISFAADSQSFLGYSYHYAAPEQIESARRGFGGADVFAGKYPAEYARGMSCPFPDARTDIYSLGATFFYLMTGVRPRAPEAEEWKKGVRGTAYSPDLFRIVLKAMAADPKKRYLNADRMRKALERRAGRTGRLLLAAAAGAGVLILGLLVMAGVMNGRRQREENFAAAYTAYIGTLSAGDGADRVRDGIALLNDREFADQFEKKPAQKAAVLEAIAAGCYEEGSFREAADYYREALSLRADAVKREEDARDLILALVKSGDRGKAQQELEAYRTYMSSAALQYMEVEFLLQEGKKEEALMKIDGILTSVQDQEILFRCSLYGAECLEGTGEYARRIGYLNQAERYLNSVLLYRRIGEGFIRILEEEPEDAVKQTAAARALACYERLCADDYAGYVDRLNLAAVRQLTGKYEEALELLKELMEEAPEDYRAYRDAAFLCYQTEQKKAAANRSSQPVRYYGERAFEYYDEKTGDEQMIRLKELLDRLSS